MSTTFTLGLVNNFGYSTNKTLNPCNICMQNPKQFDELKCPFNSIDNLKSEMACVLCDEH